jgi:ferritin-like metal-binding protein YciE
MLINTLEDLLKNQIEDLHSAETQMVEALPKMAKSANCNGLKASFEAHLEQTKVHVSRLEEIAKSLNFSPTGKTCHAMKGLCEEGREALCDKAHPTLHDADLIAAAQRIEHYEIAAYGTARELAECLGHTHSASLLDATLAEEKAADSTLTRHCRDILSKAPRNKCATANASDTVKKDENRDPITGEHGSHAVGTGVGAAVGGVAAGAVAGAAIGTVAGPVGTVVGAGVGAIAGAVAGGYAGKSVAESFNPTIEHNYWRQSFSGRPYYIVSETYESYGPAYQYGWESYFKYAGQEFSDIEMELERGWTKARGASKLTWAHAKPAVHDGWDKIAGKQLVTV